MGTSKEQANETCLKNAPTDTISSVKFSPTSSNFLLAGSWDGVSIIFRKNVFIEL